MMTGDELEQEAIETIREIAGLVAEQSNPENPGATMIAILITAYSKTVGELLATQIITLEEALRCTSGDLDIIQAKLREVAQLVA
jgi:hypothetical protein